MRTTMTSTMTNSTTMNRTTSSLRRLAAVLAVAGVATGACGSSPFSGEADAPTGGTRLDRSEPDDNRSDDDGSDREQTDDAQVDDEQTDGVESPDACEPLDEARRLSERYGELVDGVVFDAERAAEDDPDVDREEIARDALSEMIVEFDPTAGDLLDAYHDAADAAHADLASDLDVLTRFTEDTLDSWRELIQQPDFDPEEFLDVIFAGDEELLLEAVAATRRVNAFTIAECGFEFSPGA